MPKFRPLFHPYLPFGQAGFEVNDDTNSAARASNWKCSTSMLPVPYLLHGVRFAGSHRATATDSTFHFHAVFPAHQQEGASPGSPMSPLPAGPGPTQGYQGPGEGRGCWASPTPLQGAQSNLDTTGKDQAASVPHLLE